MRLLLAVSAVFLTALSVASCSVEAAPSADVAGDPAAPASVGTVREAVCRNCSAPRVCCNGSCILPTTGTQCGTVKCGSTQLKCDGACINPKTDDANCGGCGNACQNGRECLGGSCQCISGNFCGSVCCPLNARCGDPATSRCDVCPDSAPTGCGSSCSDTTNDADHCGSCGVHCAAGQACCKGGCVDAQRDEANCGGCGVKCGAGETCESGACTKCPIGSAIHDGTCLDCHCGPDICCLSVSTSGALEQACEPPGTPCE